MTSMDEAGTQQSFRAKALQLLSRANLAGDNKETVADPLGNLEDLGTLEQQAQWAAWVNSEYLKCKTARLPFENQWYINLAFVNGRHYVTPINVAGQGMRLTVTRTPPWRVRLVVNKIRTAVRKECAKLSQSRPIPTVVPATTEDEDFAAASVGEQLLNNEFANAHFGLTYRDWIWWGSVCGVSFLKTFWAPNEPDSDLYQPATPKMGLGGTPLIDPETNEPIMEESPDPVMGKIVTERVTPFHLFVPDLLTVDLNKQPYVIQVMTRSVLWVEENLKPQFKVTPDAKSTNTVMEAATLISKGSEEHLDSVLVKEMWIKPYAHKDFPKGGLLTVVNGQCVQVKREWPCAFPEFPYYKYDGIPTGGFYSDSMIVDLIPLQKEYNRTKSQMIEIKNTIGKPKLLYQKGSLNPKQISTEPGQAIPYIAGYQPPIPLPGAEVPQSMVQELQSLTQDFDDISNQHEISRGDTPNNAVSSGTAIAFLQEQDDTSLSYQIASIEYAMEMLGKHYLKYVSTYWSEARTVRITGDEQAYETKQWKGSDLRGNTDVKVQAGSALPVSKAARQAMITEMMQLGYIDPADGMDILELGALTKVVNEMLIDKKQAQRENLIMANMELSVEMLKGLEPPEGHTINDDGQPIDLNGELWSPQAPFPVNSWDNHEAHIQWHNNFRKTQKFMMLPEENKKAFELHVQTHQMAISNPQEGTMGTVANQPDPALEAQMAEQEAAGLSAEEQAAQTAASGEQQLTQSDELHQMDLAAKEQKIKQSDEQHRLKLAQEELKAKLDAAAKINAARSGEQG